LFCKLIKNIPIAIWQHGVKFSINIEYKQQRKIKNGKAGKQPGLPQRTRRTQRENRKSFFTTKNTKKHERNPFFTTEGTENTEREEREDIVVSV
jgi:hypothetical protein